MDIADLRREREEKEGGREGGREREFMKKSRSADDIEALRSAHSSRLQGDDGTKGNSSSSSSGNGIGAGRGRNDRDNNKERENSLPTIYPPPDYVQLDNNLHRARPPILEHNLPFLSHRGRFASLPTNG